jgi:hypothetical protein
MNISLRRLIKARLTVHFSQFRAWTQTFHGGFSFIQGMSPASIDFAAGPPSTRNRYHFSCS